MKLVIFDLDQTLVDAVGVHNNAAREVFRRFFGIEAYLTELDFAGRSLYENFLGLARLKGLPEEDVKRQLGDMLVAYEDVFIGGFPEDGARYRLPGVPELLEALERARHVLVLYTGDSRRVAEKMLDGAGLTRYFPVRFFGTEVAQRSDMVKMAIEAAGKATGRSFRGRDIVVVGDSIRDIEAGQAFHALTIAVATGAYSADELRRRGADYVFPDLGDCRKVIAAIES